MIAWIKFDVPKIEELKNDYLGTMEFIKEEYLPKGLDLKSPNSIRCWFNNELGINLKTTKIEEIQQHYDIISEADEARKELVLSIITYLKIKYTVYNYLNCIMKHANTVGVVMLRQVSGKEWLMPNRRKLPYSPDIIKHIIAHSDNVTFNQGEKV